MSVYIFDYGIPGVYGRYKIGVTKTPIGRSGAHTTMVPEGKYMFYIDCADYVGLEARVLKELENYLVNKHSGKKSEVAYVPYYDIVAIIMKHFPEYNKSVPEYRNKEIEKFKQRIAGDFKKDYEFLGSVKSDLDGICRLLCLRPGTNREETVRRILEYKYGTDDKDEIDLHRLGIVVTGFQTQVGKTDHLIGTLTDELSQLSMASPTDPNAMQDVQFYSSPATPTLPTFGHSTYSTPNSPFGHTTSSSSSSSTSHQVRTPPSPVPFPQLETTSPKKKVISTPSPVSPPQPSLLTNIYNAIFPAAAQTVTNSKSVTISAEYAALTSGNVRLVESLIGANGFMVTEGNLHLLTPNTLLKLEWEPTDEPTFTDDVIKNYAKYFKSISTKIVIRKQDGRLGLGLSIHSKRIDVGAISKDAVRVTPTPMPKGWYDPTIVIHPYVQLLFYKLLYLLKHEVGETGLNTVRNNLGPSDDLMFDSGGMDANLAALMRFPTAPKYTSSGPLDCDTGAAPRPGHVYRFRCGNYHSDYLINFCRYPVSKVLTQYHFTVYQPKYKYCEGGVGRDPQSLHKFTHTAHGDTHECRLYTTHKLVTSHCCDLCL